MNKKKTLPVFVAAVFLLIFCYSKIKFFNDTERIIIILVIILSIGFYIYSFFMKFKDIEGIN